jgi:hypothetical protein
MVFGCWIIYFVGDIHLIVVQPPAFRVIIVSECQIVQWNVSIFILGVLFSTCSDLRSGCTTILQSSRHVVLLLPLSVMRSVPVTLAYPYPSNERFLWTTSSATPVKDTYTPINHLQD